MSQAPPMAICLPPTRCKLSYRTDVLPSHDQDAVRVYPVSTGWSQALLNDVLPKMMTFSAPAPPSSCTVY